jgi:hypothetical protein
VPKEHGAYAQALLPLITGIALGRPTVTALLLVTAVLCVFFAHEPLLVALGRRGARARQLGGAAVRRRGAWLVALALLAGASALAIGSGALRLAAAAPLLFGATYGALVVRSREKTLARDLLVACAFSSMALPVGIAAGGSAPHAATGACVWAATFGLQTLAVKGTIAAGKKRAPSATLVRVTIVLAVAFMAGALLLAAGTTRPGAASLAVLPAGAHALVLGVRPAAPRHLRRVGWSLVVVDVVVLAALCAWLPRLR